MRDSSNQTKDIGTNKAMHTTTETDQNTRGKDGERSEGVRSEGVRSEGVRSVGVRGEGVKRTGRGGRKAGLSLKKQQPEKDEEQRKGRKEGREVEGEEEVVCVSQPRTRERDKPPPFHTE